MSYYIQPKNKITSEMTSVKKIWGDVQKKPTQAKWRCNILRLQLKTIVVVVIFVVAARIMVMTENMFDIYFKVRKFYTVLFTFTSFYSWKYKVFLKYLICSVHDTLSYPQRKTCHIPRRKIWFQHVECMEGSKVMVWT